MNQSNRLAGVVRFASKQIAMRIYGRPLIHDWIDGTRFYVSPGDSGITQNVYCGLHEHREMLFLLHLLRPEDLFVDIGANVGSYTLLASGVTGASSLTFEPVPVTFARLKANIELNELQSKVKLFQLGLAGEDGELIFSSNENCTNHVRPPSENARDDDIRVPVKQLDHVLNGQEPRLLKIDVEGFETCVLAGARQTLQCDSLSAVIMELNGSGQRYGFDEKEILHSMKQAGFETATYEPFERQIVPLDGKCLTSGNTLFLRNLPWIQQRIESGRKVTVNRLTI